MSNQEDTSTLPPEPAADQKPVRKRAKAKKKVPAKPRKQPSKRKVKIKSPVKRGKTKAKAKTKARKPREKSKANIRNKLYKLLKVKLPKKFKTRDGEIDFKALIGGLKMTPEGVYKWFRGDHMAARNAMPLVKLTKGRVKPADLIPFVF